MTARTRTVTDGAVTMNPFRALRRAAFGPVPAPASRNGSKVPGCMATTGAMLMAHGER